MIQIPPRSVVARVWPDLVDFVGQLSSVWWPSGTAVTSWYRDPAHNRAVGGSPDSQHQLGLAFDVVVPTANLDNVVQQLRRVGVVAVVESDHIHLQAFPAGRPRELGYFDA